MTSITEIADEINHRGKFVAAIGQDGVMQITTAPVTYRCPLRGGTGELKETERHRGALVTENPLVPKQAGEVVV